MEAPQTGQNTRDLDEAFWQSIVFPEEDRRLLTTSTLSGAYRWFKSTNVVPIEKYRGLKARVDGSSR
jgi:hypothetical protein